MGMRTSSPRNLVEKLKALDLWPMSSSVVALLEAEVAAEAAKASEAYVASLTRKKVAAFVAAMPTQATAPTVNTTIDEASPTTEGGKDADAQ